MLAAVVRPLMLGPSRMMVPAPRKPRPVMTWALRRAGSGVAPKGRYCQKISWLVVITAQAPRATSIWVRIPAGRWVYSRSVPMTAPTSMARSIRRPISRGDRASEVTSTTATGVVAIVLPPKSRWGQYKGRVSPCQCVFFPKQVRTRSPQAVYWVPLPRVMHS